MTRQSIVLRNKAAGFLALGLLVLAPGRANAEVTALSVEDAVRRAVASDPRAEGAAWDSLAARARIEEAQRKRLPGLTLSAGYTRLSDLTSEISFGSMNITIDSLDNVYTLAANAQYPVFSGFRLEESVKLAELQAQGKDLAAETTRRAVAFETARAYWEAIRATNNARMLAENLELTKKSLDQTKKQFANGTAMNADLLLAQMREEQAEMESGNADTATRRALMTLGSLVSVAGELSLVSEPGDPARTRAGLADPVDEEQLVKDALARRPETRSAAVSVAAAEAGEKIAEAPLYPALNLAGNYTYADPNSRVAFQSDPNAFTGTWSVGLSLSYDLGGLPANLSGRKAQTDGIGKSLADAKRLRDTVELDVRGCVLTREQTARDIDSVTGMLDQAQENERVTRQKVKAGTANEVDLLGAQIARLRSEYAIINKKIDLEIAAADLRRAAAMTADE